jgi:hypothetical protein
MTPAIPGRELSGGCMSVAGKFKNFAVPCARSNNPLMMRVMLRTRGAQAFSVVDAVISTPSILINPPARTLRQAY